MKCAPCIAAIVRASRMVGDGNHTLNTSTYDAALNYIREHKEIRDVLISGVWPIDLRGTACWNI